jgi:hypothetical protein
MDNGSRPFCLGNEDIKRVLLNCPQTKEMENYVYEQKKTFYNVRDFRLPPRRS